MSILQLLLFLLVPCITHADLTWGSAIPGTTAANVLPRSLTVTFTSTSNLVAGDNITLTPRTQAGGRADQPWKVLTPNLASITVTLPDTTCSASGLTTSISAAIITLGNRLRPCNITPGTSTYFIITNSMVNNTLGDVIQFDLQTNKDAAILNQPGWVINAGIVENSVTALPSTLAEKQWPAWLGIYFRFTVPLQTGSVVTYFASESVFNASTTSTPDILFSATCTASYTAITSTALTLTLKPSPGHGSCSATPNTYISIPQTYLLRNPSAGTQVYVNVATLLPTNNISSMTAPQYTTTSESNLIVIFTDMTVIIVNTTFSSKYVYQGNRLDTTSSLTIITVCDNATTAGTYVVYRYLTSNADSYDAVCGIPKYQFVNCAPFWIVNTSCQQASSSKFHPLTIGPGVIIQTFIQNASAFASPSPAPADGSNKSLLYLLFLLLLIPIIAFIIWWCCRRRRRDSSRSNQKAADAAFASPPDSPDAMDRQDPLAVQMDDREGITSTPENFDVPSPTPISGSVKEMQYP